MTFIPILAKLVPGFDGLLTPARVPTETLTQNTSLTDDDHGGHLVEDDTPGGITVVLESTLPDGFVTNVWRNASSGNTTISAGAGTTISGPTTVEPGHVAKIVKTGTEFLVITTMGEVRGGSLAASDVTLDTTAFSGVLLGASNVQAAMRRIDALGIGAPIVEFTGNYSAGMANIDEWFDGRAAVHLQGADGQSCARRTFDLPGLTALGSVFDSLVAAGLPELYTIRVSYLGCSSTSFSVNALSIRSRSGKPALSSGLSQMTIRRDEAVTFQVRRTSGTIGTWELISRTLLSAGGAAASLDDIELQDTVWQLTDGTFLPSGSAVQKGYAFRAVGAADADGRPGLGGEAGDRIIYPGDWVVWSADTFTSWLDADNWFVIHTGDVRRLTDQEDNFLATVRETDRPVDSRASDDGASDALVWLSTDIFQTAPFLSPSTDPSNPRPLADGPYLGGRENRDSNLDFEHSSNLFNYLMYVGISPTYLTNIPLSEIFVQIRDIDGQVSAELSLENNFVKPSFSDNATVRYFVYSQGKISDSFTEIRYLANQTIRIIRRRQDRHFTLMSSQVNLTPNIENLAESQLSQAAQAKLNKNFELTQEDVAAIAGVEVTTETVTDPAMLDALPFKFKYGALSHLESDYHTGDNSQGFLGNFGATPVVILVPSAATVSSLKQPGRPNIAVQEVIPSLFVGMRTYTATIPAVPDGPQTPLDFPVTIDGTIAVAEATGLVPSVKIDIDNLDTNLRSQLDHAQETTLPAALQAIDTGAEVFTFNNTDFVSRADHVGVQNMAAVMKAKPALGAPYPITADLFVNEVTNSEITVTPPLSLASVYIPRTVAGQLDNGLDVITGGVMRGPGIVNDRFDLNFQDSSNYRVVVGMRFFLDSEYDDNAALIRVKNVGATSFTELIGLDANGLIARKSNNDGGTSSRTVTHTLYGTDGVLSHTFTGTGAQEELWRVYEARTYTINARLIANGNDEGSAALTYTIADLGTSQAAQQQTLSFANGHTQDIRVEYVANTTLYGGPGHTLRVEVDQLADNVNFDIDHIIISATYETTETVTTQNTFSDVELEAGGIQTGRVYSLIASFRKASAGTGLEAVVTVQGYDSQGRPQVYDENVTVFGESVFAFDWSSMRIGSNSVIMDNIQAMVLNTDTPLNEFPTHAVLRDWLAHHNGKTDDWLWGNAAAPAQNVEAVRVVENVFLENQILVSPDGSRWRVGISDIGVFSATKVV